MVSIDVLLSESELMCLKVKESSQRRSFKNKLRLITYTEEKIILFEVAVL